MSGTLGQAIVFNGGGICARLHRSGLIGSRTSAWKGLSVMVCLLLYSQVRKTEKVLHFVSSPKLTIARLLTCFSLSIESQ